MTRARRLDSVQEYYFSRKLKEVRSLLADGKPILNMGIGSPDLPPHPNVVAALTDAMRDPASHQYQSYQGIPELRASIADFYENRYGVAVDPSCEVLPLMGSKEGIMHISMAFVDEGDEVLIPNPGYPTYASVTKLVGGTARTYDLYEENGWLPDLDALEDTDLSRVKLMWLSYPHMPTGARANHYDLKEIVDFARRHEIVLVNDNPYSFILNDRPTSILEIDGAKDVALELNSLSKTFNMAGWRVGMLVGAEGYLTEVLKVKSNMDSGMFYGVQKGAIAALKLPQAWHASLNDIYRERREGIFQLADALGCTYDRNHVGLFVWAKLPEVAGSSERFINNLLYEKHVFVAPGTIFGSNGEGYIRFSLCVPTSTIDEARNRCKI